MSFARSFALVTGGTDGIGKQVAKGLAAQGARVWIIGRNPVKGAAAELELRASGDVTFIATDMGRMTQVRALADRVLAENSSIQILVHSAGILSFEKKLNADGLERNFAINYLGRFLLTEKIYPLLERDKTRVVNIAAAGMNKPVLDLKSLPGLPNLSGMKTFSQSQVANDIWGLDLADRLGAAGGAATVIMPGSVNTNIRKHSDSTLMRVIDYVGRPFSLTPAEGAITPLWLATSQEAAAYNGQFFGAKKKPIKVNPELRDTALRKRLRDASIRLVGGAV